MSYVQLAHNYRDKEAGQSRANVLYNFGREEHLDTAALKRLINSINRYLGPEEALASQENELLKFVSSKPMGGTFFFLDGLWQRLGIRDTIAALLKNRSYHNPVERALFAMVANRALNLKSKLAVKNWVTEEAHIPD